MWASRQRHPKSAYWSIRLLYECPSWSAEGYKKGHWNASQCQFIVSWSSQQCKRGPPVPWTKIKSNTSRLLTTFPLLYRIDDVEDDSDLRRGVPVAHKIYGIAQTVNCANYVYFLALNEIIKLGNSKMVDIYTEELINLHRGQGKVLSIQFWNRGRFSKAWPIWQAWSFFGETRSRVRRKKSMSKWWTIVSNKKLSEPLCPFDIWYIFLSRNRWSFEAWRQAYAGSK